ncbi:hypothetical protein GCM10018963_54440 [Saccharothrix longispora]
MESGYRTVMLMPSGRGRHAQELSVGVPSQSAELIRASRTVAQVAHDFEVSEQTIYIEGHAMHDGSA